MLLSDFLASSMPVARSIFVPTTPSHPAPIGRTQPLTPQSFRNFEPSIALFLMLQMASNDAVIIPPPPQFLATYCHVLTATYATYCT